MRKITRSVLCGLLAVGATASVASGAQSHASSGIVCVPQSPANLVSYGQFGVQSELDINHYSSVFCPATATTSINFGVSAVVYDRSPLLGDLCCTARVLDPNGVIVQTSTQCSQSYGPPAQSFNFAINTAGSLDFDCLIPPPQAPFSQYSHVTSFAWSN